MKGEALVAARPGRAATRAAIRGERLSDTRFAVLLAAPALAAIFVVVVLPLLHSLYLSFAEVNLVRRTVRFTGLKNYGLVFTDEMYWDSLGRTAYFVAAFVVETTLVGLGMALVLNQTFPGRPLLRSLLLIPWSLSRIVVGVLWEGILSSQFGVLNGILANLGLIDAYIPFFKHGFGALNQTPELISLCEIGGLSVGGPLRQQTASGGKTGALHKRSTCGFDRHLLFLPPAGTRALCPRSFQFQSCFEAFFLRRTIMTTTHTSASTPATMRIVPVLSGAASGAA